MVIQLSPQTEPASPHIAEKLSGAPHSRETEAESSEKTKKNSLGVFARILAGLTNKGQPKAGKENIQLAETPEESDEKTVLNIKTKNKKKDLETDAGLQLHQAELSLQEKNLLSQVKHITDNVKPEDAEEINLEGLIGLMQQPKEAAEKPAAKKSEETASAEAVSEETALKETASKEVASKEGQEAARGVNPEQANFMARETKAKPQTTPAERANAGETAPAVQARKVSADENAGNVRADNVRTRDRRRNVTFDVKDFRSAESQMEGMQRSSLQTNLGMENRVDGVSKEITLELRLSAGNAGQGQENSSATTSWEVKAGNAFEDMLARELHQNFNNDIVRHASMALKEGSSGNTEASIRLLLKPESLGNVKIHLKLAENKITGIIFVESEDALRAFEREISSLEKAFQESGFEGASLEMSLAADGRGAQLWQETEASRSMLEYFAASRYDEAIEGLELQSYDFYGQGTWAINMFA